MSEEKELKESYDLAAKKYLFERTKGKESSGFFNREIEQPTMFKLVPLNLEDKKILDIGCGPGIHLREYIVRGAEGFGIDVSSEMIKLPKEHCVGVYFNAGSAYNLEFEDAFFDVVTASFVLDHVKDLSKAVKEVKRVLKENGLFIFSIPHPIINMFRESERGKFAPSHNYFCRDARYVNIVKSCEKFLDFPLPLQDYFKVFLREGFVLVDFLESEPDEKWKEKFENFNTDLLKIPIVAFFKWKKI